MQTVPLILSHRAERVCKTEGRSSHKFREDCGRDQSNPSLRPSVLYPVCPRVKLVSIHVLRDYPQVITRLLSDPARRTRTARRE